LEEETLVRDAQLVHRVQRLPRLAVHIKQVHLPIPIRVFATDQNYLSWRHCQRTACPQWVLQYGQLFEKQLTFIRTVRTTQVFFSTS
jgi:hypothetical protein